MSRRTLAGALALGALLLACSDGAGPPTGEVDQARTVQDDGIHHVRFASPGVSFQAEAATPWTEVLEGGQVALDGSSGTAGLLLDNYQVSFWAKVGEERGVQVNQIEEVGPGEYLVSPYLTFTVPKYGLDEGPNDEQYSWGDSVLITVTLDDNGMISGFEPSGLQFDYAQPAELQMWYTGAHGDLNGDGVVDATDDYIEEYQLGLFWRQSPTDPWFVMGSFQSTKEDWFKAEVGHFSGYSISY